MSAPLSPEQRALRQAAFTIGRTFGVGGASWTITERPTGNGVTAASGDDAPDDPITAFVVEHRPTGTDRLAAALAGAPVAASRWELIAARTVDARPQDRIVSDSNPDLAFRIVTVTLVDGYLSAELAKQ